jgi:hypothetical protein
MEEVQALRLYEHDLPDVGKLGIVAKNGSIISGNPAKTGDEMVLAKAMRYRILGQDSLGKLHAVITNIVDQIGMQQTDTGISISPPQYS